MSLKTGLETCALLSKHLRTYTPLIAVIGSSRSKDVKQKALSDLSSAILESEELRKDICSIISNLVGEEVTDLNVLDLVSKIRKSWKANQLGQFFFTLKNLGIIDDKDIANLAWIETNWKR